MKYADIIIPHGRSNTVAIDFVISNLKSKLPFDNIDDEPLNSPLKISKILSEISSPCILENPEYQNKIISNDVDSNSL